MVNPDHLIGCGCKECWRDGAVNLVFTQAEVQINDGLYERRHRKMLAGSNVAPVALTDSHVAALERAIRAEGYDIQIDTETGEVRLVPAVEQPQYNWIEMGYSFEPDGNGNLVGNFYRAHPGAAIDSAIDTGRIAEQLNRFDGGDAATRADAGAKLRSLGMFRHPETGEKF